MKTYEAILISYAIISFSAYWIYVWQKWGVQKSISDSYYRHENKFLWWLFILSFCLPLMIVGSTGLMFFAGAGIGFVSASPDFRQKMEGKVHVAASYFGIIMGFISMIFDFQMYVIFSLMAAFTLIAWLGDMKNKTWWVETAAFVLLVAGLLISKL